MPEHKPHAKFKPRDEVLPSAFPLGDLQTCNDGVASGSGPIQIVTPAEQWAFAAAIPFRLSADAYAPGEVLVVRVEAEVHNGQIGIGCVDSGLRNYVSSETDWAAGENRAILEFLLELSDDTVNGWLVVRNTGAHSQSSRVTLKSIRTFRTGTIRIPDLLDVEAGQIHRMVSAAANRSNGAAARKFRILLTHTSRNWDRETCSREHMIQRYGDPKRLAGLPPFGELPPPPSHLYSGGLTILELTIRGADTSIRALRSMDSPFKIQHATLAGEKLVLCCENFLAVLPSADGPLEEVAFHPGSPWRIDDNWFAGLHTVFPVSPDVCLVSSSSADAVLWVDLRERTVIRRLRLPAEIYGVNYELTPDMSVNRHHIPNDLQLGHLNCAYPDGRGGCYVSTLAQGDIGHFDENGRYWLLARGYPGCHGVRRVPNGRDLYFSDSCSGTLMRVEPGGAVGKLWSTDSNWLHDSVHLDQDLYLFCLGDRNELALVDLSHSQELSRFSFPGRCANVQFVSVVRDARNGS